MKIGDKVICVNPIGELIKDKEYIIDEIHKCSRCNRLMLGVGIILDKMRFDGNRCNCNMDYDCDQDHYMAYRFRKPITDHTYTSEVTKELANKPLIKEGIEEIKEKETAHFKAL